MKVLLLILIVQLLGKIKGKVVDESGKPVEGAQVFFLHTPGPGKISQTTDSKGRFVFEVEPGAYYTLVVIKKGYEPIRENYSVEVMPGIETDIGKIILKKAGPFLYIITEPFGAEVYINDEYKALTPCAITDLSPGSYTLKIKKYGYQDIVQTIEVPSFKYLKLIPEQTVLLVRSNVTNADVLIDGEKVGKTDRRGIFKGKIPVGEHFVEVSKEGYLTWSRRVQVSKNRMVSLVAPLRKCAATLLITSKPKGAKVEINGKYVGMTNLSLPLRKLGKYRIRLIKNGFHDYITSVYVDKPGKFTVRANLVPLKAYLMVKGRPSGAKVYVDGDFIDTVPFTTMREIPAGERTIIVKYPGFKVYKTRILFNPDEMKFLEVKLKPRSVVEAAFLSLLFPGWGQMYTLRYGEGIGFMAAEAICLLTAGIFYLQYKKHYDKLTRLEEKWFNTVSPKDSVQIIGGKYRNEYAATVAAVRNYRNSLYVAVGVHLLNVLDAIITMPTIGKKHAAPKKMPKKIKKEKKEKKEKGKKKKVKSKKKK